jgi:hypothetical protein
MASINWIITMIIVFYDIFYPHFDDEEIGAQIASKLY